MALPRLTAPSLDSCAPPCTYSLLAVAIDYNFGLPSAVSDSVMQIYHLDVPRANTPSFTTVPTSTAGLAWGDVVSISFQHGSDELVKYTVDGQTPEGGLQYSPGTPVQVIVRGEVLVRAIATASGKLNSEEVQISLVSAVAVPTVSPILGAGETVDTRIDVVISCETPGATILYTTDGLLPSREHSTAGVAGNDVALAITTPGQTVLKAIAVRDDPELPDSGLLAQTYTVVGPELSLSCQPQALSDDPWPTFCFSCDAGECSRIRYWIGSDDSTATTTTAANVTLDLPSRIPDLLVAEMDAVELQFTAVADNSEDFSSDAVVITWSVELEFPDVLILDEPPASTAAREAQIVVGSSFVGAKFHYAIDSAGYDDAEWIPAVPAAGAVEATIGLRPRFAYGPQHVSGNSTASFGLASDGVDGKAVFEWRLDDNLVWRPAAADGTVELVDRLDDGWHRLQARVRDTSSGAEGTATATWTWRVDTVDPVAAVVSGPGTAEYAPFVHALGRAGQVSFGLAATDAGEPCVSCEFDFKLWVGDATAEPASYSRTEDNFVSTELPEEWLHADGMTISLRVRAVDQAGNAGAIEALDIAVPMPGSQEGPDVTLPTSGTVTGVTATVLVADKVSWVDQTVAVEMTAPLVAASAAEHIGFRFRVRQPGGVARPWRVVFTSGVSDSGRVSATAAVEYSDISPDGGVHEVQVVAVAADGSSDASDASDQWLVRQRSPAQAITLNQPVGNVDTKSVAEFGFGTLLSERSAATAWYEYCDADVKADVADVHNACTSDWHAVGEDLRIGPLAPGDYAIVFRGVSSAGVAGGAAKVVWDVAASDSEGDDDVASRGVILLSALDGGTHEVLVRATSAVGVRSLQSEVVARGRVGWEVDLSAPNTSLSLPLGPVDGGVTGSDTLSCSVVASEVGSTFRYILVGPRLVDGSSGSVTGVTNASAGTTVADMELSIVAEGAWALNVAARDVAGNVDDTPALLEFHTDFTPPETDLQFVGHTTSDDGLVYVSGEHISIRATASEEPREFDIEAPEEFVITVGEKGSSDGGYTQEFTVSIPSGAADGSYQLFAAAVDRVGHKDGSPAVLSFVRDATPPAVSVVEAVPASALTNTDRLTLAVNVSEPAVLVVSLHAPGPEETWKLTVMEAAGLVQVDRQSFAADGDGYVSVTVSARDVAGNEAGVPVVRGWQVDSISPTLSVLSSPPPFVSAGTLHFSVASSEPSTAVSIALSFEADGTPLQALPPQSQTIGESAVTLDLSASAGDGVYHMLFAPVDPSGNQGETVSAGPFVVDSTAPAISVVDAPPAATQQLVVAVCMAAVDANEVSATTTVSKDGVNVTPNPDFVAESGADRNAWCATIDAGLFADAPHEESVDGEDDSNTLEDGVYKFSASFMDAAGNSAATTVTWVLDRVPPTVVNPQPVMNGVPCSPDECPSGTVFSKRNDAVFSFMCTDNAGPCMLEYVVRTVGDGQDVGSANAASGASSCAKAAVEHLAVWQPVGDGPVANATVDNLVDGRFGVFGRALDSAGNEQMSEWYEWFVDIQPVSL